MQRKINNQARGGAVRQKQRQRGAQVNWMVPGTIIMGLVSPPAILRPLKLTYSGVLNGATNIGIRFNPNAPYTPRLGGPSGVTPGYPQQSSQYGFVRVCIYDYKCSFDNLDALGGTAFILNMNNDPGVTPALSLADNPFSKRKLLSPKGGIDRGVLQGHVEIEQVIGSKAVYYADSYRSLNNAVPADLFWLIVAAESDSSAFTNGIHFVLELTMSVYWHDRLQL